MGLKIDSYRVKSHKRWIFLYQQVQLYNSATTGFLFFPRRALQSDEKLPFLCFAADAMLRRSPGENVCEGSRLVASTTLNKNINATCNNLKRFY
jgi:hypothetical protein